MSVYSTDELMRSTSGTTIGVLTVPSSVSSGGDIVAPSVMEPVAINAQGTN